MTKQVAIIDYGMGNLHSVASAINHIKPNINLSITASAETILAADYVILPGVGAIRDCMKHIFEYDINTIVSKVIAQGQPILGICVGMQVLMAHSEENGGVDCLGVFDEQVKHFQFTQSQHHGLKVPHMGWNQVTHLMEHPLWQGIASDTRFYFVHSYYVELNKRFSLGQCEYGTQFSAAHVDKNVAAVQFHPEKSHRAGLVFLRNFLQWSV